MALGLITVLAPAQLILGDLHGLNTFEHQPAKVAAMEGHWETRAGAPFVLFALPDQAAATNRYEVDDPEARQPDPHPRARRHGARARGMAARGAAVRADRVLVVSSDGRPRAAHDRGGGAQPLAAPWRPDLSDALVPQAVHRHEPRRVHRAPGWLGDHRGRPAAVGGVRPAAHRRCRDPCGHRRRGGDLARRLRDRLRHHLPGRHGVHAPSGARGSGPARARASRRWLPRRRCALCPAADALEPAE